MRYQELCLSAFVLGAAIASDNCRHPRNMPPRHARSTPIPLRSYSAWWRCAEGRSSTKRPRLAGCKGRGRWRRVCSNAHLGRFPAAIVTGVDRIRCPVTQIFRYRLTRRLRAGASSPTTIPPSHLAARSKRARRNVALHFGRRGTSFRHNGIFSVLGAPFDRDQRMLELWNNWYETLASMEALATVIVIVVVAAGVITLAESRQR
jgi:hypothetical protein